LWPRREKFGKHIGYFLLVLLHPVLFYLIGIIIFPDISNEKFMLKDYFYSNIFLLFSFLTIAMVFSLIALILFGGKKVTFKEYLSQIIAIILFAIGAFVRYELYHIFIFCLSALLFIRFVLLYRAKLIQAVD